MATSSNNMQITAQGLLKVSRELINKRIYDSSKITTVGTPSVTSDGIANALSDTSYFQHTGLTLDDEDSIKITFSGTYVQATDHSCAWSLNSSETGYNPFIVSCYSNKIVLLEGTSEVASINNLSIENNTNLRIEVSLTKSSYDIYLVCDGIAYSTSGVFSTPIELSKYSSLFIGTGKAGSSYFWKGNIDLTEFLLLNGNEVYYSPSIENVFNFTKMLVSDGAYELTDSSTPILNHVYEFEIEELSRSGSNVLLKATIESGTYLNIKEIGLYSSSAEGTQLFSLIENLSIKKSKDIGYDLIFHVNVDLEVLNTNLYPTIVLSDPDYSNTEDFITIKNVHTNDTVDIERAVTSNSTELGYNKPQTYCRLQDKISMWEKNYTGVKSFKKLRDNFKYSETEIFDITKVNKKGNLIISSDGEASDFSSENYAEVDGLKSSKTSWKFNLKFKTSNNVLTDQAIIVSSMPSYELPLDIRVVDGNCSVSLAEMETVIVNNGTTYLSYDRDTSTREIDDVTYYAWICTDSSQTESIILTKELKPTASSVFYNGDGTELTNYEFSNFTSGHISEQSSFPVIGNKDYYVSLSYEDNVYTYKYSTDGITYTTFFTRTFNVQAANLNSLVIGKDNSSVFYGTVYLKELKITADGNSFTTTSIVYNTAVIDDYFFVPEYKYSAYKVKNLSYADSEIAILEDSITCNKDRIDFSNSDGFTLCIKAHLKDSEDKVILSKVNLEEQDIYFNFSLSNSVLIFNLYLNTGVITLQKQLDSSHIKKFTESSVLFTIIKSSNSYSPTFTLCGNNEVLTSVIDAPTDFLTASNYTLTNYLTEEVISSAENCIDGIFTFTGPLSSDQVYYLTNLFNVNF